MKQSTLNVDAQPTTRPIRAKANTPAEINQMFDSIAYGKASDVLLIVENYLGAETFRKGVHAYLAAHEYGNATAQDFWNAQTETSHKPVDKIMESLVVQPGVPILSLALLRTGKVPVAQSRFFLSPSITPNPDQKWTLPVCFKTAASIRHRTASCSHRRRPASRRRRPASSSPMPAAKATTAAPMRPPQYPALVDHVESGLTPPERISLVGDEWAQVRANKATVGDYPESGSRSQERFRRRSGFPCIRRRRRY